MTGPRHTRRFVDPPVDVPTGGATGVQPTQPGFDALLREESPSSTDVHSASVVEGAARRNGADLGSTVRVIDDTHRTTAGELIGRRSGQSARHGITVASPVGQHSALHVRATQFG